MLPQLILFMFAPIEFQRTALKYSNKSHEFTKSKDAEEIEINISYAKYLPPEHRLHGTARNINIVINDSRIPIND